MKLSPRFSDALVFAAELHADQQRKVTGTPYLAHLLRVAGIALEHGAGEDQAIAALLHDAVEDQGGPAVRDELRRRFGETVVAIVDGCTLLRGYREHGEKVWDHFHGGRDGALWYYRTVVGILKRHDATPLVEELDRAVTQLENL